MAQEGTELDQLKKANRLVVRYLNIFNIEQRKRYCKKYLKAKEFIELKQKQYATKNVYAIMELIN